MARGHGCHWAACRGGLADGPGTVGWIDSVVRGCPGLGGPSAGFLSSFRQRLVMLPSHDPTHDN